MNQRPLPAYRLAALDLDETLLGHDRAVSPRNAAAVRLLKERGLYVVIASGRMYASTYRFAEPLGLEDPIISYNGAMASWPARGEVFHHLTIPADVAAAVARLCAEEGHHLNYYLDDRLYVRELTEWSDLYHFRTGSRFEPVGDLGQFEGREPTKLILVGPPETVSLLRGEMEARFGDRVTVMVTAPEYLEFLPKGVNKAFALEAVGRRLGIAPEEMMALGDGWNDIAMLEYVGLGIAMGNAPEAVKAVADRVTATNGEDGVAQAIEQLFGEEVGSDPRGTETSAFPDLLRERS